MNQTEQIIALLKDNPQGLTANELQTKTGISPVNTINGICLKLEKRQIISRKPENKVLVNRLIRDSDANNISAQPTPPQSKPILRSSNMKNMDIQICPPDLSKTLIVIPCSKRKHTGELNIERSRSFVTNELLDPLRTEIQNAQQLQTVKDPHLLMPTWQRYKGIFYNAPGVQDALKAALDKKLHVVILSGGYGLLHLNEPISWYNEKLNPSHWGLLLTKGLAEYADNHGIKHVRVIASKSTYGKAITQGSPERQQIWRNSGVDDAILLSPVRTNSFNPNSFSSPMTQGCAFAAFIEGRLNSDWNCPQTKLRLEKTPLL